jgi:hypothetical protein
VDPKPLGDGSDFAVELCKEFLRALPPQQLGLPGGRLKQGPVRSMYLEPGTRSAAPLLEPALNARDGEFGRLAGVTRRASRFDLSELTVFAGEFVFDPAQYP